MYYYYNCVYVCGRQKILMDAEKVKQFRGNVCDQKGEYAKQKKREIEIKKKMAAFKEVQQPTLCLVDLCCQLIVLSRLMNSFLEIIQALKRKTRSPTDKHNAHSGRQRHFQFYRIVQRVHNVH
jgi:hypothetical protein